MGEILSGLNGVLCYLDDVVVYGKSERDQDCNLQLVINRLKEWGVKLNRSKCHLKKPEIQPLGHIVNKDGVKPDPAKQITFSNTNQLKRIANISRTSSLH